MTHPRFTSENDTPGTMNSKLILLGLGFVVLLSLLSPSKQEQQDKSAKQLKDIYSKMESGKQLTKEEEQRINDIMNWCDECNNTLRLCKHGR